MPRVALTLLAAVFASILTVSSIAPAAADTVIESSTLVNGYPNTLTFKVTAKDPRVIINSDGGANFGNVVAVLDEVRRVGIGKVGINTEKK